MKVGIISPIRHSGSTTTSLLLSAASAQMQSDAVCLTYTGTGEAIRSYAGVECKPDPTRSLTQVSRLLQSGAVSPSELAEYCTVISPNVRLLDTSSDSGVSYGEISEILLQTFLTMPSDVTVCDITTDLDDEVTQKILEACDVILVVTTMTRDSVELTRKYINSQYLPKDKHICAVVSRFDPVAAPLGQVASELGLSVRRVCKIPYSPMILKACRIGMIFQLMSNVCAYDPRMLAVRTAVNELLQFVYTAAGKRLKPKPKNQFNT